MNKFSIANQAHLFSALAASLALAAVATPASGFSGTMKFYADTDNGTISKPGTPIGLTHDAHILWFVGAIPPWLPLYIAQISKGCTTRRVPEPGMIAALVTVGALGVAIKRRRNPLD